MSPDVDYLHKPDNGADKKGSKVHGYEEGCGTQKSPTFTKKGSFV